MNAPSLRSSSLSILAALVVVTAVACGGNKSSEQPAAAAPAPAESAPPPAEVAEATPPAAEPQAPPVEVKPAPPPAAKPVPKKQPPPPPPPKPEPVVKTIATGTDLEVELIDAASSATSQVGSPVQARVTKAVVVDGLTIVPAGAVIDGVVTEAISLKKIGGTASLGLRFDTIDTGSGAKAPLSATLLQKGKSETGKDAGTIAGATAGGALLGRLLSKNDKTKGTIIGAVVGAAAGTGAAAATKGKEVELPAGTPLTLRLEQPLQIQVQP